MGLGEGSWDAAPLSGSRGLSSGWARQSSRGKVSSRIAEIMERRIGKGDAMQGKLQSTAQTTGEAGGTGIHREFTLHLSVQEAHGTEGWQSTQAAPLMWLTQPRAPQLLRASAPFLTGVPRHPLPAARDHRRARRQTGLWN